MIQFCRAFATIAFFACSSVLAQAQDYPNKPIRLVVGFPPGSTGDISARVVGAKIGSILGQPVVVENRAGAASSVAAAQVARSPKDGYTLFLASNANIFNAATNQPLDFDFYKDFAPVSLTTSVTTVLVVTPQTAIKSVAELVSYARANPDKLNFGGVGTPPFVLELFNSAAGTKITYVPYQGSPQVVTDLLGNRLHGYISPSSTVAGQIAAGHLVALAVTDAQRSPFFPNLPTMQEAGVPGCIASYWFGIMAPAGTPKEIVDKLAKAVNEAGKSNDVVESLRTQSIMVMTNSPEQFSRHIENDRKLWTGLAERAGFKR
jgi:tripartite-type tricarboxylate transporter receptor subunit TctC